MHYVGNALKKFYWVNGDEWMNVWGRREGYVSKGKATGERMRSRNSGKKEGKIKQNK